MIRATESQAADCVAFVVALAKQVPADTSELRLGRELIVEIHEIAKNIRTNGEAEGDG